MTPHSSLLTLRLTRLSTSTKQAICKPLQVLKNYSLHSRLNYILGNDFRFSTNLETQGNNVILDFNGDPTLESSDIANLLRQLKQQGTSTIKGNLYLNGGHFTGFEHAVGSPWDMLTQCYSAPSSSITLEHNCF